MGTWRIAATAMVLFSVLSPGALDARDGTDRRQLVVRTYDTFGVGAGERDVATSTARQLLRSAEIDILWRNCTRPAADPACASSLAAGELSVRFVSTPSSDTSADLGRSLVDVVEKRGSLCTVFVDRVHQFAADAGIEPGVLLGRAMAHELGHLLLGTNNHSRHGLMRPQWLLGELKRDVMTDWTLSRSEGEQMRRGLAPLDLS